MLAAEAIGTHSPLLLAGGTLVNKYGAPWGLKVADAHASDWM